jgi:S1-C subfamily serine protease
MSLRICLVVAVTCLISVAAELSVGDEIEVLETKSGRKYEQVKVRGILPNGLKIMHSSGTATLPASELPQYEHLFAGADPEPVTVEPKAPVTSNPAWMPKSNSDVVDCSLFVKVKKGISTDGSIISWNGSAFLCNHGSTTYIYSNAHNFDGAIELTIEDKYGNKYEDFVSIESAADGQAHRKETGQGGDVVRIRLEKYREKALTLDREPLTKHAINRKILVTGNTGGRGVITELQGVVTEIGEVNIIKHDTATEGGNSGSPIVDLETYKVIGIQTWGVPLSNAIHSHPTGRLCLERKNGLVLS